MLVSLEEAKNYLRVDSSDDDEFIRTLILTAERLVTDVSRLSSDYLEIQGDVVKVAELYAIAYLYEHREEADHHAMNLTLRALLFGSRKEGF